MERKLRCKIFILLIASAMGFSKTAHSKKSDINEHFEVTSQKTALATTAFYDSFEEDQDDDEGDVLDSESRALGIPIRDEYVGGYYDFLINEGSYKFWAVFQLATAALLIYSGFAALYYAKVNPTVTDDYEDYRYFIRRKRDLQTGSLYPHYRLDPLTVERILDILAKNHHQSSKR